MEYIEASGCKAVMPFNEVISHIKREHKRVHFRNEDDEYEFTVAGDCNWDHDDEFLFESCVLRNHGEYLLVCFDSRNEKVSALRHLH